MPSADAAALDGDQYGHPRLLQTRQVLLQGQHGLATTRPRTASASATPGEITVSAKAVPSPEKVADSGAA